MGQPQPENPSKGQPVQLDYAPASPRRRWPKSFLITAACMAAAHFLLIWALAPLDGWQLLLLFPAICAFDFLGANSWLGYVALLATSCGWGMVFSYVLHRLKPITGRKRLVVSGIVAIFLLWIGFGLIRDLRAKFQAAAILSQARRDTRPSLTYVEARRWLEEHGFFVIGSPGDGPSGSLTIMRGPDAGQYSRVTGIKAAAGDPLSGERWIEVTFRFTMDDQFKDIKADGDASPPLWQQHQMKEARKSQLDSTQPSPQQ